jgi:hypothetical protein
MKTSTSMPPQVAAGILPPGSKAVQLDQKKELA